MMLWRDGVRAASGEEDGGGGFLSGENMSIYGLNVPESNRGGLFSASEDCGDGDLARAGRSSGGGGGEDLGASSSGLSAGIRERSEAVEAADAFRIVEVPRVIRFFGGGGFISVSIWSLVRFVEVLEALETREAFEARPFRVRGAFVG